MLVPHPHFIGCVLSLPCQSWMLPRSRTNRDGATSLLQFVSHRLTIFSHVPIRRTFSRTIDVVVSSQQPNPIRHSIWSLGGVRFAMTDLNPIQAIQHHPETSASPKTSVGTLFLSVIKDPITSDRTQHGTNRQAKCQKATPMCVSATSRCFTREKTENQEERCKKTNKHARNQQEQHNNTKTAQNAFGICGRMTRVRKTISRKKK